MTGMDDPDYWVSHIEDNLYMGGCYKDREAPDHIEYIIGLDDYHIYKARDGLNIKTFFLIDYEEYPDAQEIFAIAAYVVSCLNRGKTLVHCFAGQNRSGLICAVVLWILGHDPQDAIEILRDRRFPEVLNNKEFERFVLDLR